MATVTFQKTYDSDTATNFESQISEGGEILSPEIHFYHVKKITLFSQ